MKKIIFICLVSILLLGCNSNQEDKIYSYKQISIKLKSEKSKFTNSNEISKIEYYQNGFYIVYNNKDFYVLDKELKKITIEKTQIVSLDLFTKIRLDKDGNLEIFNPFIINLNTFLLSISPFGEARVGIVYGIANGINPWLVFLIGTFANLLVYPLLKIFIAFLNQKLWNYKLYRRQAVKLSQRSKRLVGKHILKYGFWGLMIFVMIPLPGTGAYMGTIAAVIFNLPNSKAFYAISLGVFISCIIMALISVLGVTVTTM